MSDDNTNATPAPEPEPLIDEVREARRRIDAERGGHLRRWVAALRAMQERSGRVIISDRGSNRGGSARHAA